MTDGGNPVVVWLWAVLATTAGGISSLSFRPYKQMSRGEITLAFIVSSTFALFVGPLVADVIGHWLFGNGPVNLRVFGAVLWFMAAGAHFLIPVGITRAKRLISALGAEKEQ